MTQPKVSVALITYNHERFVAEALDSALSQRTSFPFEIVVGDDASTDGTRDILRAYARREPGRVRLILREANVGMNRNFADTVLACSGEYVALLEGDDYWCSDDKLQRQADLLDAHPDHVLCVHTTVVVHEDEPGRPSFVTRVQAGHGYTVEDVIAYRFPLPTCGTMFRNHLLRAFPAWFGEVHNCDYATQVLLAQYGLLACLDAPMGVYRKHRAGVSEATTAEVQLDKLAHLLTCLRADLDDRCGHAIDRRMSLVRRAQVGVALRRGDYRGALAALARYALGRGVRARPHARKAAGVAGAESA